MKNLKLIVLALGWVCTFLLLGSSYLLNTFENREDRFVLAPISWNEHLVVLDGALTCSLTSEELQHRLTLLRAEIFPNLKEKVELENGFIYYFEDKDELVFKILEFIGKEKQCCPFFKFDLSILPFKKGVALQISGSKEVKDFLQMMESEVI